MIVTKNDKNFWVIGISYKNADFITRGKFSINTLKTLDFLNKAKSLKIEVIFLKINKPTIICLKLVQGLIAKF